MLSLEVVPLPVTDVDRTLAFYTAQAGFTLDVDYQALPRYNRPRGRAGETDRPRRRGRRDPAQGPGQDVGRWMERGAGS